MKQSFLAIILLISVAQTAHSQISPGELSQPHKDLEGMQNCTQCHSLGGGPDSQKCLQCHLEVKQSLDLKKGYHSFLMTQGDKVCFQCHSDHNGRDFEMIFWPNGKENFNHEQAGFPLEGKHYFNTRCEDCHQPKNIVHDPRKQNKKVDTSRTFLGLSQDCLSCHHDEHRGQLSKECRQCHNYLAWKPAQKYNHINAKFQLTGKHQKVECVKCHPSVAIRSVGLKQKGKLSFVKYVDLPFKNCAPCHRDVHNGKFQQNCNQCHDTSGWRKLNSTMFDHSLTRFPLLGLHSRLSCEKCHNTGIRKMTMAFANCSDCHNDTHFGQFVDRPGSSACESCHDVFGFTPAKFDVAQHNQTEYPLTGAHLAVPCISCHIEVNEGTSRQRRMYDFGDVSCQGCHQDVHKGQFATKVQLGGCESCHQTSDWALTIFDHSRTRFPLFGKHAEVQCRQCHMQVDVGSTMERILFKPMEITCHACHDDIHLGQFQLGRNAKTCDTCHTPAAWVELIFDHNRDSLFRLRGSHEQVPCMNCHKVYRKGSVEFVLFKPMDRRCVSCHD